MQIWYHSSAIFNNMQFPQSYQTIRMNQILASDHHCLYMLWALLSLVLDHLFQYQQYWQCLRTGNHRSSSIAGWCILHSHQLCPSYGGHCKCKSTHDLVTQWGCPDKPWQKADATACGLLYASRHQAQTALLFWYPMLGNHTDGNI